MADRAVARREGKRPAIAEPAGGAARKLRRADADSAARDREPGLGPASAAAIVASASAFSVTKMVMDMLPSHGAAAVVEGKLATRPVMLDNPPTKSKMRENIRAKGPRLSRRQLKELGLMRTVQTEGCTFADFIPLHQLWCNYIDELVGPAGAGLAMADKLAKADYHGACFRVVRSKSPELIGITGIVIQETENTLRLICQDDRPRTVPKRNSVFTLRYGGTLVTVHGNHICFRASERARHKFKARPSTDL